MVVVEVVVVVVVVLGVVIEVVDEVVFFVVGLSTEDKRSCWRVKKYPVLQFCLL